MNKLPNDTEIKTYNSATVIIKEPYRECILGGKPLKASAVIASRDISIETDKGYYCFNMDDVISVQFLK